MTHICANGFAGEMLCKHGKCYRCQDCGCMEPPDIPQDDAADYAEWQAGQYDPGPDPGEEE